MRDFSIKTIDRGITSDIVKKGLKLNRQGISDWLKDKSLLQENEELDSFEDITPWLRTGSETYSTTFSFSSNNSTFVLIAKAIVTINPEKSLLDWARRRQFLLDNNISVSNWYWAGEATIIETFYPFSYTGILKFEDLLKIAFSLDRLGFSTLKFLDDLRCDLEGNPHWIDFGFDLGEASGITKENAKQYLLKKYSQKKSEIEAYYEAKQSHL